MFLLIEMWRAHKKGWQLIVCFALCLYNLSDGSFHSLIAWTQKRLISPWRYSHWSWSIAKQKKMVHWWDRCSWIPQTSVVVGRGGKTWENGKKIKLGQKIGQKHLKKGLKRLDLVWYSLVMTQLWSLVNPECLNKKKSFQ